MMTKNTLLSRIKVPVILDLFLLLVMTLGCTSDKMNNPSVYSILDLRNVEGELTNAVLTISKDQLMTLIDKADKADSLPVEGVRLVIPELPGRDLPLDADIPIVLFPCSEPQCTRTIVNGRIICECDPDLIDRPDPEPPCGFEIREDGSLSCGGSCWEDEMPCIMSKTETECGLVLSCHCEIPSLRDRIEIDN